jgi:predicted xylose isomerase-like sugar epimerase
MKTFIAIVSLFTILTVQASTMSVKALLGIESRIEIQREALSEKLNSVEIDDLTEGKIIAAMANMIEKKLAIAEEMLNSITSEDQLTEEAVAQINDILDQSEKLIQEI